MILEDQKNITQALKFKGTMAEWLLQKHAYQHKNQNKKTLQTSNIGYWFNMEIFVRVLVRSNIARRQEQL